MRTSRRLINARASRECRQPPSRWSAWLPAGVAIVALALLLGGTQPAQAGADVVLRGERTCIGPGCKGGAWTTHATVGCPIKDAHDRAKAQLQQGQRGATGGLPSASAPIGPSPAEQAAARLNGLLQEQRQTVTDELRRRYEAAAREQEARTRSTPSRPAPRAGSSNGPSTRDHVLDREQAALFAGSDDALTFDTEGLLSELQELEDEASYLDDQTATDDWIEPSDQPLDVAASEGADDWAESEYAGEASWAEEESEDVADGWAEADNAGEGSWVEVGSEDVGDGWAEDEYSGEASWAEEESEDVASEASWAEEESEHVAGGTEDEASAQWSESSEAENPAAGDAFDQGAEPPREVDALDDQPLPWPGADDWSVNQEALEEEIETRGGEYWRPSPNGASEKAPTDDGDDYSWGSDSDWEAWTNDAPSEDLTTKLLSIEVGDTTLGELGRNASDLSRFARNTARIGTPGRLVRGLAGAGRDIFYGLNDFITFGMEKIEAGLNDRPMPVSCSACTGEGYRFMSEGLSEF